METGARVDGCTQIDELEAELDMEQRRGRDSLAEIKKLQRQLAELRASSQSEHHLVIEYTETINNLEMKMLALRKQFEHSVCSSALYDCLLSHLPSDPERSPFRVVLSSKI